MNVTVPPLAATQGTRSILYQTARRAAEAGGGRVVLLAASTGAPWPAHRRRVLKVLLQDAAQIGGGQVFETTAGELLLMGASAVAAERASHAMARLAGEQPLAQTSWLMPADAQAMLAWAEGATLPVPTGPQGSAAGATLGTVPLGLGPFDALVAALKPERVMRRQAVLRAGNGRPSLEGRRLFISHIALAAELGAFAADPDLLRHAADMLAARLPDLLADGGPLSPPGPLLVPLPSMPMKTAPRPGLIGVLPATEATDLADLANRRLALARAGWGLAIGGLTAAALRLLAPEALAADLLLITWSSALARLDPPLPPNLAQRVVLVGCNGPEAVSWGAAQGITRFTGPHVEMLLAAARLAQCPHAAGCTQRQCEERASASAEAGRGGCRNLPLLDAMLPGAAVPA